MGSRIHGRMQESGSQTRGQKDREESHRVGRQDGRKKYCYARIGLCWVKERFKVHQWEERDTKQIPDNSRLWSLAREAAAGDKIHNRTGKLESGSPWKASFIAVVNKSAAIPLSSPKTKIQHLVGYWECAYK